jgi:hypothetical protein
MNPEPPPGAEPGEQILEGVVPLIVDGMEVDVTVASVYVEAPSIWPGAIGLLAGFGLGSVAWTRRDPRFTGLVTLGLAAGATLVSTVAFFSVPIETEPSIVQWVIPLTSGVLAAWALRRPQMSTTLLGLAALELLIWSVMRREWMAAAILPTALPFWADRAATGAVMAGALLVVVDVARSLFRGQGASSLTSTSIS